MALLFIHRLPEASFFSEKHFYLGNEIILAKKVKTRILFQMISAKTQNSRCKLKINTCYLVTFYFRQNLTVMERHLLLFFIIAQRINEW